MDTKKNHFDTLADYQASLFAMLEMNLEEPLRVWDTDLRETGLESVHGEAILRARLQACHTKEGLRIVLQSLRYFEQSCPRLMRLFRQFDERVGLRLATSEHRKLAQTFVLSGDARFITRFHRDMPRGKMVVDEFPEAGRFSEQFEDIWAAAAPVSVGWKLGL